MNSRALVSFLASLAVLMACKSKTSAESDPTHFDTIAAPSPAASQAIERNAAFLRQFRVALPESTCSGGQWFRECFHTDQTGCEARVKHELEKCIIQEAEKLPTVKDATTGTEAGKKLGSCAGTAYEITMGSLKIDSPECRDLSRWVR